MKAETQKENVRAFHSGGREASLKRPRGRPRKSSAVALKTDNTSKDVVPTMENVLLIISDEKKHPEAMVKSCHSGKNKLGNLLYQPDWVSLSFGHMYIAQQKSGHQFFFFRFEEDGVHPQRRHEISIGDLRRRVSISVVESCFRFPELFQLLNRRILKVGDSMDAE